MALLDEFFLGDERNLAIAHTPNDRFVFFRIERPISIAGGDVVADGILFRDGKDTTRMKVALRRVAPTDLNPFGLSISSVTVAG